MISPWADLFGPNKNPLHQSGGFLNQPLPPVSQPAPPSLWNKPIKRTVFISHSHLHESESKAFLREFGSVFHSWYFGLSNKNDRINSNLTHWPPRLKFSQEVQKLITSEIHTHSAEPSCRRLLVPIEEVTNLLAEASKTLSTEVTLSMKVYVPRIDRGISYPVDQLHNIVLYDSSLPSASISFLFNNVTTLLEIQINRSSKYVKVSKEP
jgi:hypothetical protein